ncbi:heat shock protein Hsp20 [Candidatus Magnetoovum chiemensis]|nr:heat shock protein Hsp20 [Candidatus Magnetoovum chiemensis]
MTLKDFVSWTKDKKGEVPVRKDRDYSFPAFTDEAGRVFDRFLQGVNLGFPDLGGDFSPKVDVVETDKEFNISVELPGIDEKDIDVSLTKDSLTIKGEKKEEKEDKHTGYYHRERYYGSFTRTIPMTCEIDADKVKAEFKNGVLSINLPKTQEAQKAVTKITVKAQ